MTKPRIIRGGDESESDLSEMFAALQQGHQRLLIVDGHGSHHTLEFVEFCDSHDVVPFGMPPHLTHLLQLSSSVFSTPVTLQHAAKMRDDILSFLDGNPGLDPDFSHAVAKSMDGLVSGEALLSE
jgi:hypothetical protein